MVKINYCAFAPGTGYGQSALDIIMALHRSGKYDIRVELFFGVAPDQRAVSTESLKLFKSMMSKDKGTDRIQFYHCIPTVQRHVKPMSKNIGMAVFETFQPPNRGPNDWISILNRNDAVVVPSKFNQKIFSNEKIIKPIFLIPHSIDERLYKDGITPLHYYDRFTFLFFGSWRVRKGYQQLIEAWCREFDSKDNVQLLIKTDRPSVARATVSKIRDNLGFNKKEIAPILYEDHIVDEISLPSFFKSCNCLISPHAGEGFCLPGLQCMALGVPIAITDFAGCQDYANDKTCTLISPSGFVMHPCMDGLPQFANKKWALVDTKEVCRVLRYVYSNYDSVKEKAKAASNTVKQEFSYAKTEQLFSGMLRDIYEIEV